MLSTSWQWELSKVCLHRCHRLPHTSLCAALFMRTAPPSRRQSTCPSCAAASGWALGLTEPGAGTDAQGQQTIAKEEDDCWVLNGSKIFLTNAGFADVFIVIAVTDHVLDKKGRPPSCALSSSLSAPIRASAGWIRWASVVLHLRADFRIAVSRKRIVCWACAARA